MSYHLRVMVISVLIILVGCAELKIQRNVHDNVFYSNKLPQVNIKVNPDFVYLGKAEKNIFKNYSSRAGGDTIEHVSYIFAEKGKYNHLKKVITIHFYTVKGSGFWLPDLFSGVKTPLDSGVVNIEGNNYQYCVTAHSSPLMGYEQKLISDKGYVLPNCLLVKGYGRRVDSGNKTKFIILYAEDIRFKENNNYQCNRWQNVDTFHSEQKNFLSEFLDRCNENLRILPDSPSIKPVDVDSKSASDNIEKKLESLKDLLNKGLITQDDYDEKKSQILKEY
jgi:hypothetical protein